MDELAESGAHLRLAAAHAAGGAAHRLTPAFDRARTVANRGMNTTRGSLAPLYDQMRDGAMNARTGHGAKARRRRWPVVMGIVAAGAAVGAAGAMVARRRRAAAEWDEFEPMGSLESGYGTDDNGRMGTAAKKVAAGAASVAGSVSSQAGKVADSLHGRTSTSDKLGDKSDDLARKAGDAADKARDSSKNSHP